MKPKSAVGLAKMRVHDFILGFGMACVLVTASIAYTFYRVATNVYNKNEKPKLTQEVEER